MDGEQYKWNDFHEREAEAKKISYDILTARGLITDALGRYKKKKLNARNKAQAEDMNLRFAELENYTSERDLQDAYGYDIITEKEYERLTDLWELRKSCVDENGKFHDRITELLESAMYSIGEKYMDELREVDNMRRLVNEREKDIERKNIDNDYKKYKAGL